MIARGGRRRVTGLAVGAALAAGVLVAHLHASGSAAPASASAGPAMSSAGRTSEEYQLVQYPASPVSGYGFAQIHQQTVAATHSIDMSMYELTDPIEISDLIAARDRGVVVRVILDRAYSGQRVNAAAYARLRTAGVLATRGIESGGMGISWGGGLTRRKAGSWGQVQHGCGGGRQRRPGQARAWGTRISLRPLRECEDRRSIRWRPVRD